MIVDLFMGSEGLLTLANGERAHTLWKRKGDNISVRYESGWYCEYTRDGKRLTAGHIVHPDGSSTAVPPGHARDIVGVEFCKWTDGMPCGFEP